MTLQLIDIAVQDRQAHPRLPGRSTGHVRAVLTETIDGQEHTHELTVAAWADHGLEATEADIDMALMLRAARVIARLKGSLSTPD
ncbi:MAG: hypothetical protein KKF33_14360 [Alphaproteobacteria bacterium]|jgi:hypothetical protein|nr:hypothetical protein [Alphaproteobacteria bacterium]